MWIYTEDGLNLVDVERPGAHIRATCEELATGMRVGFANGGAGEPGAWRVESWSPTLRAWLVLATYRTIPPGPGGEQDAEQEARSYLSKLASELNAGRRRPGESPADVTGRFKG